MQAPRFTDYPPIKHAFIFDFLGGNYHAGADPDILHMAKNLEITGEESGKEEFQQNGSTLTKRIITPSGQLHQEVNMEFGI